MSYKTFVIRLNSKTRLNMPIISVIMGVYNCKNIEVTEEFPTVETNLSVGGGVSYGSVAGLASFDGNISVGYANAHVGALGCISREIAEHFGKYFSHYILKSWYGDKINVNLNECGRARNKSK